MDHSKCSSSTGIDESVTVGQGDLDPNGYWEFPCYKCARMIEKKNPTSFGKGKEYGEVFPFADRFLGMEKNKLRKVLFILIAGLAFALTLYALERIAL